GGQCRTRAIVATIFGGPANGRRAARGLPLGWSRFLSGGGAAAGRIGKPSQDLHHRLRRTRLRRGAACPRGGAASRNRTPRGAGRRRRGAGGDPIAAANL